ncbi:Polarized growth protein rax2 [Grifola frondosa]|uniref:Polarized growth protein rax2 n=1 Tax=Grifola frondosa TaxID=5627 RepID=A0A1C7LVK1_GRIFR|nr:Polarized growth protein rax2 [Grifola frondosa]
MMLVLHNTLLIRHRRDDEDPFVNGPLVDFDRMGKVGLAGAFAGLDLVDNSTTVSFDPSTASLLTRSSDGSLSKLASTNSGGSIAAGCALNGAFYVAGNFTSIDGTSANNIASYTASGVFASLGSNGPNGAIQTLFCDTTQNKVWAGGRFASPGSSVAVWDPNASSWSAAPFGGLSGAAAEVLSITTNSSQSSLFFSGSFTTTFGNGSSIVNTTNNPNVPFSSGATPFSSSLVPVPLQGAQVVALPSTSDSQFSDINNTLCPSGADGPGNTWFAADGNQAVITVRKFSFLSASGVRIGNTFLDGRGTTGFSVTTIPDNTVQTLSYFDPQSSQNKTCTDPCPLLTDPTIPYQDFLFDSDLDITGIQLTLSEWNGAGPGLHLLQLLSSGAFASAVDSDNTESCFAPNPSNATHTGMWTEKNVNTNISGTTQAVLVSQVAVGTPAAEGPSFTWMPYVSASGQYNVSLLIPGCTDFQDCALRTSVKVTVFPGAGLQPWVTSVSQQNTADAVNLIYSGPIVPSSPQFVTTITMTLDDQPVGSGQNGEYELVADRVQMVLTSANVTASNGTSAGTNSTADASRGFGFFEWPLNSQSTASATSVLPNQTETSLDRIGFELFDAVGGTSALTTTPLPSISTVAHHVSGAVFLGGQFALTSGSAAGASNIVVFKNGALATLPTVLGGSFTDTASPSTSGLRGVAMYDVQQNQWSSLQAGVDGAVFSLDTSNDQLLVAGNFTKLLTSSSGDAGENAAGFAAWNISSSSWVNSGGFLVGSMTFVGNGTSSSGESQFVAGNVAASLKFGASGFVMLQNGADGEPQVTPLGVQFDSTVDNGASTTNRRRSHTRRSAAGWIPRINVLHMFKRQTATTLAPLPTTPPAPAPAVLAGAFWTNSSSSKELVVIGGNFSFSASGSVSQNVAIYDDDTRTVQALRGNQVNGTVRSLLVQGDQLYVGGEFTVEGINVDGLAIYDLAQQQWDVSGLQALQASSGSSVVVRSITVSPSQSNIVIVAGSFAQAGSTPCRSVCSLDTSSKQWSALGNGIQGEVAAVNNQDTLIVSGSIALADSTPADVAAYSISNGTWSAVGNGQDLPGPVTAVEVNNGNASSIFAAGRSSDGSSSFLYFWNGQTWSSVGSTLQGATDVSQLTMVPLQNTHAANGVIEPDRVLMVSGSLSDSSFGNASSALFDGQTLTPYIVSTSSSGSPGTISSLFHSFSSFSFTQHHFLATGVVILISIAIAAGIVFLLALIGILWTLFARRDDKLQNYDAVEQDGDDDSIRRPSSLLAHINAATRTTILGVPGPFGANQEKEAETAPAAAHDDPFEPDASNYVRAETPSDAIAGTMDGEDMSRSAHARYSFDGAGEGELALSAGQEVEVLDDRDAAYVFIFVSLAYVHSRSVRDRWWYARDVRTGREGVVPAAYVY